MSSEPEVVGLRITGSRMEADVILGCNKVKVVVNTRDPEAEKALAPLMDFITVRCRADLATQLDRFLSPGTKRALSRTR